MKKMIALAGLLAICGIAYADSLGPDPYNHTRVAPQFVSPDGGRIQGKASAEGYQYVEAVSRTPDGGTVSPRYDGDGRAVVAVGGVSGACLGADLTTTSGSGPTLAAGIEYRVCALTDLWISWAGGTAAADAPSEPLFARTCIVRGPLAAQTTPTAILPAGASVLAGKELIACPVTRPQ